MTDHRAEIKTARAGSFTVPREIDRRAGIAPRGKEPEEGLPAPGTVPGAVQEEERWKIAGSGRFMPGELQIEWCGGHMTGLGEQKGSQTSGGGKQEVVDTGPALP